VTKDVLHDWQLEEIEIVVKEWLQEHPPQRDYNNIAEEYRQELIEELEHNE
jgi:hypothetical protein